MTDNTITDGDTYVTIRFHFEVDGDEREVNTLAVFEQFQQPAQPVFELSDNLVIILTRAELIDANPPCGESHD